jgi:hypothetical protein
VHRCTEKCAFLSKLGCLDETGFNIFLRFSTFNSQQHQEQNVPALQDETLNAGVSIAGMKLAEVLAIIVKLNELKEIK